MSSATTEKGKNEDCNADWETRAVSIDSYHKIESGVDGLKTALSYQPILVGMHASGDVQHYVSGVYESPRAQPKSWIMLCSR